MRGQILFLEDDAGFRNWVTEQLKKKGYEVKDFFRVDQVKEYFSEHKSEIDLLIVDLNMEDKWLENYKQESYGGFFTGWVWLEHFVYDENPDIPTIIYSGFIDVLDEWLKENNKKPLSQRRNITCVNKGVGDAAGVDKLLNVIQKVLGRRNNDD